VDRRIDPARPENIARRPVYPRGFRTITPANLEITTPKIGATQAALRAAHLKYHLSTVAILTREQVTRYNELRIGAASSRETHLHVAFSFLKLEAPDQHCYRVQKPAIDVSLYLEEQRLTQRQFDLNRLRRTCDHTKRLRGREGQLIFLSGALERFRRVLDSINDLVVSLYWHQSNDLVLTTSSVVLERAFEIDNLAD